MTAKHQKEKERNTLEIINFEQFTGCKRFTHLKIRSLSIFQANTHTHKLIVFCFVSVSPRATIDNFKIELIINQRKKCSIAHNYVALSYTCRYASSVRYELCAINEKETEKSAEEVKQAQKH